MTKEITGYKGFTVEEINSILPDFPENVIKVGKCN